MSCGGEDNEEEGSTETQAEAGGESSTELKDRLAIEKGSPDLV